MATERYEALMRHYGMEPSMNNAGEAHENGDVEQSHHRFKEAVDQALREPDPVWANEPLMLCKDMCPGCQLR